MRTAVLSPFLRLFFCVGALWGAAAMAAGTPAATVTGFHAALLDNMKHGNEYRCDGRAKRIGPVVDASFDLPAIAQSTLRRYWSKLSAEQREQFIGAFREQVVATYADQFADFDGDSFTTLDTQSLPNGDQLVHAKLQPGSGDVVKFDYVLRQKDDSWRVTNIIADGVSNLALWSTQYAQLYNQKGYDGLLAWLKQQTEKTRAGCK